MIASRAVNGVAAAMMLSGSMAPISILIGLLSAPAGRLADRFGAGPLMAAGSALVACAYAGLWLAAPTGQFWSHVVPLTALAGLGLGLVVAPLTAAAMQGAEDGEQGAASGVNTPWRGWRAWSRWRFWWPVRSADGVQVIARR